MTTGIPSTKRLTTTRSFAVAAWLLAKNFELVALEKARDGSAGIIYCFPAEAYDEMQAFYVVKNKLNDLTVEARRNY